MVFSLFFFEFLYECVADVEFLCVVLFCLFVDGDVDGVVLGVWLWLFLWLCGEWLCECDFLCECG